MDSSAPPRRCGRAAALDRPESPPSTLRDIVFHGGLMSWSGRGCLVAAIEPDRGHRLEMCERNVTSSIRDSGCRCLLVVDPRSCILRFKVGVCRASEPVARCNFYPCRHEAGHHIPHTRKALGPNPCYQRAPSLRTVARRQPAAASGALTFNSHDAPWCAIGNEPAVPTRRGV